MTAPPTAHPDSYCYDDPAEVAIIDRARLIMASSRPDLTGHRGHVVTCAPSAPAHNGEIRCEFADSRWQPVPHETVAAAVAATAAGLQDGRDVVVRCQQGLNRSGLVVALTLRAAGFGAADAVAAIRTARGPLALCNPYFADLVHAWPRDPMTDPTAPPARHPPADLPDQHHPPNSRKIDT